LGMMGLRYTPREASQFTHGCALYRLPLASRADSRLC
jgi:hypothetical protein